MKKICVIGLGYIGLPTATVLADSGHTVVGVDTNEATVATINQGKIHIAEPHLAEKVAAMVQAGRLRATSVPEEADAFVIAVPTPITAEKKAELSYVKSAARSVAPYLRKGNLVILESTVPPRTTVDVLLPLLLTGGLTADDLLVAFCPERVLPGKILTELVNNSRVIGGIDAASAEAAKALYATFVKGELFLTDATTAEMTKLMENTYRDVNIALANEFALIAEQTGVNVWDAIRFANKHPRVNILQPGPGVGGHCIAVDPWFIVEQAGGRARLIHTARIINDGMPQQVIEKIRGLTEGISKPKVALLGLTYKPNVDDCRESPAVEIAVLLRKLGFTVAAFDPLAKNQETVPLQAALRQADLTVLLVNHDAFAGLDPQQLARLVRRKVVLDTRGVLDRAQWEAAGFTVVVLGEGALP
ncbi:MAG TPA: UDP-N-acetyl-D-mannosamine dehydrogenase, partial [Firmicutes bacterium]|nr:UDP-N-acetyl-D-mannosamine dehydrogenase [Bacillota bacterium]